MIIVASLGTICLELIRSQLLLHPDGLPLGLLFLKQRFVEAQYLTSSEFRFGLAGFSRLRKRILVGCFIVTATLISLLAGPSAAILMIPVQKDNWPAGGASFWLYGDEELLWPSILKDSSIGGEYCRNANLNTITQTRDFNLSGCIWASSLQIATTFQQSHLLGVQSWNFDDGFLDRVADTRSNPYQYEQWIAMPHLAVGIVARRIGDAWYQSILSDGLGKFRTLRYRARNETTSFVKTWIPAVRTQCEISKEGSTDSGYRQVCVS